jgi:hypothetical protein
MQEIVVSKTLQVLTMLQLELIKENERLKVFLIATKLETRECRYWNWTD